MIINKDFIKDIDFMDNTIKKLNLDKNSKILDIGTGIGAMCILLAINGFNVLTGEPKEYSERDENDHYLNKNHHNHEFEWEWSDWRESAKIIGVENIIEFRHFTAENLPFSNIIRIIP